MDDKKKRILIFKKGGLTTRFDYTFLDDIEFDSILKELATKLNVDKNDIISYTLGNKDETEEGVVHFCPKCGTYNEYGYAPEVNQYYKIDKESNEFKAAGFYKTLDIDCPNCNENFNINTAQFEEESEKLTEAFLAK